MNPSEAVALRAQIETSRGRLVDGAGDLPESVRGLWKDALAAIDKAIKLIEPARVKVHKVWAERDLTLNAKNERSIAAVTELYGAVSEQLTKAERLLDEIAYQLDVDIHPARPADVSEAALARRIDEIATALRDRMSGNGERLEAITRYAVASVRAHDDLTLYCLAGGPLDFLYTRCGMDRRQLRRALFKAIRDARLEPIPGEGLLRMLEAPHDDPASWAALRRDIESMAGTVAGDAANGLRLTAMYSPGWGVPANGEPRRVEQPGTPLEGTPMKAPEFENLQRRQTYFHGNDPTPTRATAVPPDLQPSLDTSHITGR